MYGYIYITTNLLNNMIYVGQHKSETFNPKYLGSGINIQKAVKKYGRSNFKVELLEWCDTKEIADELEKYYIQKHGLPNSDIGYNITNGGQERFFTGCKHTISSKQKMSVMAKNREHKPTTLGRKCYTDGEHNKLLKPEDFEYYESIGWWMGKTCDIVAWNKGLTKDTDERVKQYSEKRSKIFQGGESVGCFGIKGNTNGFKKGHTPWNKGLKGYNNGHPNYYHGKNKNK